METVESSHPVAPSLLRRIKAYRVTAREIQGFLSKQPQEWGRFQSLFNFEVNGVFREIMNFEKENLGKGNEEGVYKLKHLFIRRLRPEFLHGELITWSLKKPFGYAGDYKVIDDIYLISPKTSGFDRLFDNYFQMSAISVAVRNRKEDFKKLVLRTLERSEGKAVRVMNLGSGPCRELAELSSNKLLDRPPVTFDCYDNDERAHAYARKLLGPLPNINYVKENVVRLALKKDILAALPHRYDLIYSCGLFDYLDDRVSARLIGNLGRLLKDGGQLSISDVRDKYANPSVHFMEWVGDWSLIYRDDDNFRQLFLEGGFEESDLTIEYEQQGIMQYITASR